MKAAAAIAHEVARLAATRVAARTIRYFQSRKDCTLSGDDSELENVWDEICVQVQSEESVFWEFYKDTVSNLIADYIEKLPSHEQTAIWLDSDEGLEWQDSDDAEEAGVPPLFQRRHRVSHS